MLDRRRRPASSIRHCPQLSQSGSALKPQADQISRFLMRITERTRVPWDKRAAARGELSLSDTSSVLSFEEGWQASKARKRPELTLAAHSMDGVIGRELPRIGTIADSRKPGSPLRADSGASPSPAEHAMLEAAIQLDLITPRAGRSADRQE